jgi:hypothetical protein
VKKITNKETRQLLLQQLRNAVCLQIALWDTSRAIESALVGDWDVLDQVMSREKTVDVPRVVTDSDLEGFLMGLGGHKCIQANREIIARHGVRAMLVQRLQNIEVLLVQFREVTTSLAATLNRELRDVVHEVSDAASTADSGMELSDMDLAAFLDEPIAESFIRQGWPLYA